MRCRIKSAADEEINAAILFLNSRRANLGWEFYDELTAEIDAIAANPRRCRWIDARFRLCFTKRFKYFIVYEPESIPTTIVAVYQHARNPDYWRSRVQ